MKRARACPICPACGSKKFERLGGDDVRVRCISCNKVLDI